MDRDWVAQPTYESERIGIDGTLSPVVLYDMKQPRFVEEQEIGLMLSIADFHLDRGLPFVGLVRHTRGTGIVPAPHREAFAEWLDMRAEALKRDEIAVVVVVPEAIYRAVLRVVYRFRTPPIRTITVQNVPEAAGAVRRELQRIGPSIKPETASFLETLSTYPPPSSP